jgi:hypothetical protein
VKAAHLVYGEVLAITKTTAPPAEMTPLLEPLREVGRAIGDYMLQVAKREIRTPPEAADPPRPPPPFVSRQDLRFSVLCTATVRGNR